MLSLSFQHRPARNACSCFIFGISSNRPERPQEFIYQKRIASNRAARRSSSRARFPSALGRAREVSASNCPSTSSTREEYVVILSRERDTRDTRLESRHPKKWHQTSRSTTGSTTPRCGVLWTTYLRHARYLRTNVGTRLSRHIDRDPLAYNPHPTTHRGTRVRLTKTTTNEKEALALTYPTTKTCGRRMYRRRRFRNDPFASSSRCVLRSTACKCVCLMGGTTRVSRTCVGALTRVHSTAFPNAGASRTKTYTARFAKSNPQLSSRWTW